MSTPIYLFDDARARRFEPFALTRPLGAMTAGFIPTWSRWQTALRCEVAGFIGAPHLVGFDDGFTRGVGTAPRMATGMIGAGSIVANARFAPRAQILPHRDADPSTPARGDVRADSRVRLWRADGRVAAVRVGRDLRPDDLSEEWREIESLAPSSGTESELHGWWIEEVWDFVRALPTVLADDLRLFVAGQSGRGMSPHGRPPAHVTTLGDHPILVGEALGDESGGGGLPASVIEPHVVLDASAGPIVIAYGAHVHAFTRLVGPCYIGDGTTVLGGDITACSIGPVCKVRGEMSNTIMLGYANKGHDGFVGHSILGRWSNLGAGTITSNLKNTYGTVTLWTPDGLRDTGMQFLGTMFGDHAKTGIGTRLTTGTVLGAGANVHGSTMPPKAVPPFAWGEGLPYAEWRCDKFLEVAARVMARRKITMSEGMRRQLAAAHAAKWTVEDDG